MKLKIWVADIHQEIECYFSNWEFPCASELKNLMRECLQQAKYDIYLCQKEVKQQASTTT